MKTTKSKSTSTTNTKRSDCKSRATNSTHTTQKNKKSANRSSSESQSDPYGSYTGNPVGMGKFELPIQDADDL